MSRWKRCCARICSGQRASSAESQEVFLSCRSNSVDNRPSSYAASSYAASSNRTQYHDCDSVELVTSFQALESELGEGSPFLDHIKNKRLLSLARLMENSDSTGSSQALADVPARAAQVRALLDKVGAYEQQSGWQALEAGEVVMWRRWDPTTKALQVIMSWEARGALVQQVAVCRDAELAEPLWEGACWDMWSQHAGGASMVRWLQKDPFTGKRTEVIQERVICDCLDEPKPCYVILERSPDVMDWDTFSGPYGLFHVPAKPPGVLRAVFEPGGKVLEPISPTECRVTMTLTLRLPGAIRWVVTDSVLILAVKQIYKSSIKAWNTIVDGWSTSEYPSVQQQKSAFYASIEERVAAYLDMKAC